MADPRARAVARASGTANGLLSSQVVSFNTFGLKLVDKEFLGSTALNDILGTPGDSPSTTARKLWGVVETQVDANPDKYFKAIRDILEYCSSLDTILKVIDEEYKKCKGTVHVHVHAC